VAESDPAPPSGDLKHDIESFAGVEACARARGTSDPVLADAIDALGYDTLTRDACRVLEALKSKDKQLCKPIASSPLRTRCESNVAVLVGDPRLCPLTGLGKGDARDPLCLARARRDDRLCAAMISSERASCKAMVSGRAEECRGDESCIRQVERWKSVLEKPAQHTPFTSHLHVEITPDKGTADPPKRSFDLDDDAAAGAIIKLMGDKMRITLGTPKSPYWPSPDTGYAQPKIFLEVTTVVKDSKKVRVDLAASELTLDLLLPKVGTFSALTSDQRTLEMSRWSNQMGQPLKFTITTKLGDAPHTYGAKIEVETFVRDVVEPAAASELRP